MKGLKKSLAVATIGGASIAAWMLGSSLIGDAKFARAKEEVEASRAQLGTAHDLSTVFRSVGKVVSPSVVHIEVKKSAKTGRQALPFNDDMLRRFFPDKDKDGLPDIPEGFGDGAGPENAPFESMGTGSGVIMEAQGGSGFILTNNHVAGGASEITVTLSDGRMIKGDKVKVVGTDPKTDLAVVKITADKLLPAKWGDSDELQQGDYVCAFGSPFGYIGSMSHGIVSALHRQAGILQQQQGYENFIQVDAPINPGNSGGPLSNLKAEVIGINTAIASRSGSFSGLGFAIPSNQAKFVYNALKEKGKVVRGWLGVSISDVEKDTGLAKSFGFKGDKGVLVQETFANTPATGKLQRGDIVTELNGKSVDNVQQLRNTVAATSPGSELKFKVWREDKFADIGVKIGEQPEDLVAVGLKNGKPAPAEEGAPATNKNVENLGLRLSDATDELIQKFGLGDDVKGGAIVTGVKPNSPAAKAGLRSGDVITRVNNQTVKDAKEANALIAKQDVNKGIRFYTVTPTGSRFVFVEP